MIELRAALCISRTLILLRKCCTLVLQQLLLKMWVFEVLYARMNYNYGGVAGGGGGGGGGGGWLGVGGC